MKAPDLKLSKRVRADLLMLLAAMIWGGAFSAQRVAAKELTFFWFNGIRFLLGALVLLPLIHFRWRMEWRKLGWVSLAGGLVFLGSDLQQAGLETTSAANAGFLTTLYTVFVPILLAVGWRQRVGRYAWVAALLAVAGGMLLSTGGVYQAATGDALEVAGALAWAFHVIVVSRAVRQVDVLQFSFGQFVVCGLLNLAVGVLSGDFPAQGLVNAWWAVAYAGFLSVGVAYTLQVVGQKTAPPADAAILLSMEAVFAAVFGFLLLGEGLSGIQLIGCALLMAAILLVQWKSARELHIEDD
jgi:drug/metabolite transporter (DMT)-like permease